jgi:hypothetical protein
MFFPTDVVKGAKLSGIPTDHRRGIMLVRTRPEAVLMSAPPTSNRLLVEGAVIVASILLAFAIDRGYESYQERREEAAILEGLRSDFLANQEALESHLEWYDRWSDGISDVQEYISGGSAEPKAGELEQALTVLFANPTFDPSTATLDVIESSGRGSLLSDPELRVLIAEWRVHTTDALDQQQGLQRNRESMLWPTLVQLDVRAPDGSRALLDIPNGPPPLQDLRASGLAAVLDVHSALLGRTRQDLVQVLDATELVLNRLDALLGQ